MSVDRQVPAQDDVTRPPPTPIRDLNALADGHNVDPPTDPRAYPLTASSWPELPRVVGTNLFFIAHDATGRRLMQCFESASTGTLITPVTLPGVTSEVPNPRCPTTVMLTAAALCFAVKTRNTAANEAADGLFATDGTSATAIPFDPLPAYVRIDSVAATTFGVEVLAVTAATANGAGARHSLWRLASGNKLTKVVETSGGTTFFPNAGNLVQVTGIGPDYPFYAFTAEKLATVGARCLVVIKLSATPVFRELAVPNPALLQPFGSEMLVVDMALFGTTDPDKLQLVDLTSTTPGVLTSAPRIRNLTVVDDSSGPVLLYTTQSGTSTSQLASYDKRRGVSAPTATNNVMPASVASILGFNGAAYVLGTTPGLAGTPTLWLYDAKTNKIDPLSDFPALSAPGSLTAWVEGSTRLAFLATRSVAGGQQPLISVSSAAGTWSTVDIPRVEPATRPELLTRVGVHLFFSATDVDRGQEPWYWQHN